MCRTEGICESPSLLCKEKRVGLRWEPLISLSKSLLLQPEDFTHVCRAAPSSQHSPIPAKKTLFALMFFLAFGG